MLAKVFEQVAPELADTLVAVLIAVFAAGFRSLLAHTKNAVFQGVETRLDSLIETVVKEVEQTYVSNLKDANGDLTSEQQAKATELALASLKSHLGEKGLKELAKVFPAADLEKLLFSYIQASVHDLHASKGKSLAPIAQVTTTADGGMKATAVSS